MLDARATLRCLALMLVAGGAGLLAGLLVAPSSGRETRRMLRRRAQEESGAVERKVRRAAEDASYRAKQYGEDQLAQGKQALSTFTGAEG